MNGPSNWHFNKIKNEKIILIQSSLITVNESNPSTSILFRNKIIQENIYMKFIFVSKVAGEIFINFKYLDNENFIQLKLQRLNENKGKIILILNKFGIINNIAELDCDKMISFLNKCTGFEIEKENKIEIYNFNKKYVILFNDMIIFNHDLNDILSKEKSSKLNKNKKYTENNSNYLNDWVNARISIGMNNQKNFEIYELQIKNLNFDDVKIFQNEISDMKNYATGKNYQIIKDNNKISNNK